MSLRKTWSNTRRALLLVLLTLGIAALFSWWLPTPRPAPIAPATNATFLKWQPGLSATSFVHHPGPGQVLTLSSGPVADAADATTRAVRSANSTALSDYGVEPFVDARPAATFDDRHWSWRKRVGYGKGDFEAEITIAPNGTVESATVRYLTQELVYR